MSGMNKAILLGNLGSNPELRYTQSGVAVLSFRMATNESWIDKNKVKQERTEWHSVVVWGPRGEALSRLLGKGSNVLVEGGLRTSSYEKDGVTRYKTEVFARDVFLTGRRATATGSDAGGPDIVSAPRVPQSGPAAPAPQSEMLDELPF